jgi:hypothetical protein
VSSLWTPDGEHPVGRPGEREAPGSGGPAGPGGSGPSGPGRPGPASPSGPGSPADEDAIRAELDDARARVAEVPAEVVVLNHAMGLYELAAIHLSMSPPNLGSAALAIDAFGCLVEGLGDRLGPESATLRDALGQVRLAFVQIKGTMAPSDARADAPSDVGADASSGDPAG